MLEVFKFDLQEEYDWLGWLALTQLVERLQEQEECLDLQEALDTLNLLKNEVKVREALPELLRLETHRCAVV